MPVRFGKNSGGKQNTLTWNRLFQRLGDGTTPTQMVTKTERTRGKKKSEEYELRSCSTPSLTLRVRQDKQSAYVSWRTLSVSEGVDCISSLYLAPCPYSKP